MILIDKYFWLFLCFFEWLVILQGICAWHDNYFSYEQLRRRGIYNGYAFLQHAEMWTDFLLISPLLAYIIVSYNLPYISVGSVVCLLIALFATYFMVKTYQYSGIDHPEAYTHDDTTTMAGWIHALYMTIGLWIFEIFYFPHFEPAPNPRHMIVASCILSIFFFSGQIKFKRGWRLHRNDLWQIAVCLIVLWETTIIKTW